jgi:hypothetical protein
VDEVGSPAAVVVVLVCFGLSIGELD